MTPHNIESSHLSLEKETKENGDSFMNSTYAAAGMEADFTSKTTWMFVKGSYETATVNFELETQVDLLSKQLQNMKIKAVIIPVYDEIGEFVAKQLGKLFQV